MIAARVRHFRGLSLHSIKWQNRVEATLLWRILSIILLQTGSERCSLDIFKQEYNRRINPILDGQNDILWAFLKEHRSETVCR